MRIAVALVAALLVSAPTSARPVPMSVAELIAQHVKLRHKVVRVRGWLRYCAPDGCGIAVSMQDEAETISIGPAWKFDQAVRQANAVGREVALEARVETFCSDPTGNENEVWICADRVSELSNPRLLTVF